MSGGRRGWCRASPLKNHERLRTGKQKLAPTRLFFLILYGEARESYALLMHEGFVFRCFFLFVRHARWRMGSPLIKAFVLCDFVADSPGGPGRKNLTGAGLSVVRAPNTLPLTHTFWVYIEVTDQRGFGRIQLALLR